MTEQTKKWYVVRAISGNEKKVKQYIDSEIKRLNLSEYVSQVLIPTEKVYQIRKGKKISKERNYYPESNYMNNTSDLRYFCYCLVRKYGSPAKASEEQKANEFRKHYLGDLHPSVKALRDVAISCGIKLDSSDRMPANLRGFNQVINGTNNIIVKDGDTVSGMQNTILHEIREIMEGIFPTVCRDYKPLKTNAKHYAANKFATAVLLPEESFTEKV